MQQNGDGRGSLNMSYGHARFAVQESNFNRYGFMKVVQMVVKINLTSCYNFEGRYESGGLSGASEETPVFANEVYRI